MRGDREGLKRRKENDPISPFTTTTDGTRGSAFERNQERSKKARRTDEAFNAPVADSFSQWQESPDRYDWPGVDTVPEEELNRRGRAFLDRGQELGAVEEVERKNLGGTKKGEFKANPKNKGNPLKGETGYETKVQANKDLDDPEYPAFGEGSVLAHETGHAFDFEAGGEGSDFMSRRGFFARNEGDLFGEARKLSERVRGGYNSRQAHYREDERELVADSLAAVALEPRAAKREAPNLVPALEDELDMRVGDDDESVFEF